MMRFYSIILSILTLLSCCYGEQSGNVLFIGNSFTYFNNMPTILKSLASENGKSIHADKATKGGYSIIKHSKDSKTLDAIAAKKWDIVVLQGHSLEAITNKKTMIEGGEELANKCKGSKIFLFATWAYQSESRFIKKSRKSIVGKLSDVEKKKMFKNMGEVIYEGYDELAKKINARVIPVGFAWDISNKKFPDINLYSKDQYHPSKDGSYLTALVFYRAIYGELPKKVVSELTSKSVHENMLLVVEETFKN